MRIQIMQISLLFCMITRIFSISKRLNLSKLYSVMAKDPMYSEFFANDMFLVVGASDDRTKFGNKVLRCYVQNKLVVFPVSKRLPAIETIPTVESLTQFKDILDKKADATLMSWFEDLPTKNTTKIGISIVTPPGVTKVILEEALENGFQHIFLQPGTYDSVVDDMITKEDRWKNMKIHKGCVLVQLGFSDSEPW